jgi:hypothetical protein
MSESITCRLEVRVPDLAAEITVLNGRHETVGSSVGSQGFVLTQGLYKVRVRAGAAFSEHLVALDRDREVLFGMDDFELPTPVPLVATARTHEYHRTAAVEASRSAPVSLGKGATLLIFSRDWTPLGSSAGLPLDGLTLHDCRGDQIFTPGEAADTRGDCDVSAACKLEVDPGFYRLRLTLPDGTGSERALMAVAGWQVQLFMLMRTYGDSRRVDLGGGAVVMSRTGFHPSGRGERVSVLARYALTQGRPISGAVYDELLALKFEDPMLGLFAAHLLLRDQPERTDLRAEVLDNLRRVLGEDHPDVNALRLRETPAPVDKGVPPFHWPPMLRAGWDLITVESVRSETTVREESPAARVASLVRPTTPWLTWETGASEQEALTRARERKTAILEGFVRGLRETTLRGGSLGDDTLRWPSAPSRTGSGLRTPPGSPSPGIQPSSRFIRRQRNPRAAIAYSTGPDIELDEDVRAELARTLGVTGSVLNEMLSGR